MEKPAKRLMKCDTPGSVTAQLYSDGNSDANRIDFVKLATSRERSGTPFAS